MQKENLKIHVFAFASFGKGLSGGDNIFIELARHWSKQGNLIVVHLFQDGYEMCQRFSLKGVDYRICKTGRTIRFLPFLFLFRTIYGIIKVFKEKNNKDLLFIYSASDFWPDAIPAFIFSRIHKNSKWIAGFYMFAPSFFKSNFPYSGLNIFRGIFYYFTQIPIFFLVKAFSDFVFVTSEPDVKRFITGKRDKDRVIVIKGGVDLAFINSIAEPARKYFDCVFMGRLHPQKGVLELVDIWNLVVQKMPQTKLAIIGDGYLKTEVSRKIKQLGLENNIVLFGYKFGKEKIEIFKSSRVVLHPAIYDSGGMSSCEAMACGLAGVSFDLDSLKTYYPKGMLKTRCFDLGEFAQNVIELLINKELYERLSKEAVALVKEEWDWNLRAGKIYSCLTESASV